MVFSYVNIKMFLEKTPYFTEYLQKSIFYTNIFWVWGTSQKPDQLDSLTIQRYNFGSSFCILIICLC